MIGEIDCCLQQETLLQPFVQHALDWQSDFDHLPMFCFKFNTRNKDKEKNDEYDYNQREINHVNDALFHSIQCSFLFIRNSYQFVVLNKTKCYDSIFIMTINHTVVYDSNLTRTFLLFLSCIFICMYFFVNKIFRLSQYYYYYYLLQF